MDKSTNSSKNYVNSLYPDEREHVELFVSLRDLKRHLPSTQVKLYMEKNGQYEFHSQTEVVKQNINPNFTTSFIIDYFFAVKQNLKFEIIEQGKAETKSAQIGNITCTLGEIVGAKKQSVSFELTPHTHTKSENLGRLFVRVEKVNYTSHIANMSFRAEGLKLSKGLFAKHLPDVAVRLYRRINETEYNIVFQSERRGKTDAPRWRPLQIKTQKLCNGETDRPIKVEVVSQQSSTHYTTVGEAFFTLEQLTGSQDTELVLEIIHPRTKKHNGTLHIEDIELVEKPHFLDYLRSGLQLNLMLGIDYTTSNGEPSSSDSLHAHRKDGTLNEYQKAIKGVCDILLNYDSDKRVLMFGFGGIPSFPQFSTQLTSQCFPLTGDPKSPWVEGVDGIMDTYKKSFEFVDLASPTYFEPMLRQGMRIAKKNKEEGSHEYTIILILTDGKCHDMQDSINAVIDSCFLPMSVIIVGVGKEDFTKMEILDGDDGLINDEGKEAERDLVQFVPFREYENNPDLLAKHVLEEIPDQVVEYMISQNILPKGIDDQSGLSKLLTYLPTEGDVDIPNETARDRRPDDDLLESAKVKDTEEAVIFKGHKRNPSVSTVGLGDSSHFSKAVGFMKKKNNKYILKKYSNTEGNLLASANNKVKVPTINVNQAESYIDLKTTTTKSSKTESIK